MYYYMVQGKGWSNPYVFASPVSWPDGSYVLIQAQRPGGMPGENYLAKGIILETLTESDADTILDGRQFKEVICGITDEEYANDACRLPDSEIIARQKRGMIR